MRYISLIGGSCISMWWNHFNKFWTALFIKLRYFFLLTSAKQLNLNPQNYKNIFFYFLIYFFFVICVFRSGGSKWVRSENFFSGIQNHYFGAELNPGDQTGFTTLLFLIFYLRLIKILYDFWSLSDLSNNIIIS